MFKKMNPVPKKFNDDDIDIDIDIGGDSQTNLVSVNNNKIMFHAAVNAETCHKLLKCLSQAMKYVALTNALSEFDVPMKVYLHICSNGGDVYSALAVVDTIISSKIDVVTVCEGFVASAGVFIALSGKERFIRKHAYMLIHELRSGCYGKYSECQDDMKNNDILMNDMKAFMNERCQNKLLKKKLSKVLKHDLLWDSNKCLKFGLVEKIV